MEKVLFRHPAIYGTKAPRAGDIILTNLQASFMADNLYAFQLAWPAVTSVVYAPAKSGLAVCKIKSSLEGFEEIVIELTGSSKEMNILELGKMRAIIGDIRQSGTKKKETGVAGKRQQLLDSDSSLAQKYQSMVEMNKLLTDEEFWAAHTDVVHDFDVVSDTMKMKKGDVNVRSALLDVAKRMKNTPDGKIVVDLPHDLKLKIFSRYPHVRRDFEIEVPDRKSETEFWQVFFLQEFFHNNAVQQIVNSQHVAALQFSKQTAAKPSSSINANTASTTTGATGAEVTAEGVHETLEKAKHKRKFDSLYSIPQEFDLTSTFEDYARHERMDSADNALYLTQKAGGVTVVGEGAGGEAVAQVLNEESSVSMFVQQRLRRDVEVENSKPTVGDHGNLSESSRERFAIHRNSRQGHLNFDDMDSVLEQLPSRQQNGTTLQLRDQNEPSESTHLGPSNLGSGHRAGGMMGGSASDALSAAVGKVGDLLQKTQTEHSRFSYLPTPAKAMEVFTKTEVRIRKQIADQRLSSMQRQNPHNQDYGAHDPVSQQRLREDFCEVSELLLHFYGLLDRKKILLGALYGTGADVGHVSGLNTIDNKVRSILDVLHRKQVALEKKKQAVSNGPGTVIVDAMASRREAAAEIIIEMLAQIQRADYWWEQSKLNRSVSG